MPIYEYKCCGCGAVCSILVQGFRDPDNLVCAECGGSELKRMISRVNYHVSSAERLSSYDARTARPDSGDTRNIGLHAEKMLQRAGVEPTDDFKAKLEKVRTDPASVIRDHEG